MQNLLSGVSENCGQCTTGRPGHSEELLSCLVRATGNKEINRQFQNDAQSLGGLQEDWFHGSLFSAGASPWSLCPAAYRTLSKPQNNSLEVLVSVAHWSAEQGAHFGFVFYCYALDKSLEMPDLTSSSVQ